MGAAGACAGRSILRKTRRRQLRGYIPCDTSAFESCNPRLLGKVFHVPAYRFCRGGRKGSPSAVWSEAAFLDAQLARQGRWRRKARLMPLIRFILMYTLTKSERHNSRHAIKSAVKGSCRPATRVQLFRTREPSLLHSQTTLLLLSDSNYCLRSSTPTQRLVSHSRTLHPARSVQGAGRQIIIDHIPAASFLRDQWNSFTGSSRNFLAHVARGLFSFHAAKMQVEQSTGQLEGKHSRLVCALLSLSETSLG